MEAVTRSALTFLVGTTVHAEVDLKQMDPLALVRLLLLQFTKARSVMKCLRQGYSGNTPLVINSTGIHSLCAIYFLNSE